MNDMNDMNAERNKPWSLKVGFLVGGGLLLAGVLLQWCIGPVRWAALAWPLNGIALAALLVLIVLAYVGRKRVQALRFIGTGYAAIPAMTYAVVLTMVMGLVRQDSGGKWFAHMLACWPFVLVYVYMAFILGFAVLKRWRKGNVGFVLNHLGLFVALTTATLGNADLQRVRMIVGMDQPERRAITPENTVSEMPLAIRLKRFIMETYDDGSPKRFASELQIQTEGGKDIEATVDVNKPCKVDGWKIYQYGYDTQLGAESRISVLELVRDPWLPLVYAGICMMLAGAVCMFFNIR